jgi:serine/threonine protein kinase/Tfp pilus assembly protein PilF
MIGKKVSHYRVIEVLGEGGMGTIYRAEDERLHRQVALKFLKPKSGDTRETERLIREARAAATLDHPNICTIYEIDETDDGTFIAMACVEGADLRKRIATGALQPEEAIDIATQIAEALREAHGSGIVHLDVKPANIMLTPKGVAKITDFGLAELFEPAALHDRATSSGTVAYMSPERLRSESTDHRADIWSLGVVLYEMLAGRRPFQDDYDQAVVYSVLNLEPASLADLREDVSDDLANVVSRCLAKNVDDRYQSMDELLADLKAASGRSTIPGAARRPIAVIGFENLSGDSSLDYLQRAIPNLLITSFERSEQLRVTTWERMRDLMKQLDREDAELIDRELGFELCKLDGIETIVVGGFTKAGDVFATDVKVLDVGSKRLLASSSAKGKGVSSILASQVDELSRDILLALDMPQHDMEAMGSSVAEVTTGSMEAYDSFLRGRECYEKLYNTDARRHLEEAVRIDPDFAAACLYLAWTYARLRQPEARDRALERAQALSARATRKERLYIEAAYARTVALDSARELQLMKEIVRDYPGEKRAHHRLAGIHRAGGRLYQAIEEYNRVLALDPEYGWAMNELGYMHTDIGDYERAAEYFERYASVSPGDANPVDSMGELCFRMGRLDEAIDRYKDALNLKPDFYYAYWEIAYVSALKEDYSEALKWIATFIERAPSFGTTVEGHRWRCFYKLWLGRYSDALSDAALIERMAEEEGSLLWQTEAGSLSAWIHFDRGDLDESQGAFEACLTAVKSSPRDFVPAPSSYSPGSLEQVRALEATYQFALAMLELRRGDTATASARMAGTETLIPDYATLFRSEALLAEGRADRAIALCENASQWRTPYMSDPESMLAYNLPPLRDTLARSYVQAGEFYKAIEEYERLLAVGPSNHDRRLAHPRYRLRLASLYEKKGWLERARHQYRSFLDVWADAEKDLPEIVEARARLAKLH